MKKKKLPYPNPSSKDSLQVSDFIETYNKTSPLDNIVGTSLHILEQAKSKITYKEFNKIFSQLPFLLEEWAQFLGISERTLQRYEASNGQFSVLQTERIQHIKELSEIAEKIFGKNKALYYQWSTSKVFSLNNQRPLDLMTTYKGTEMCMSILQNTLFGGVA